MNLTDERLRELDDPALTADERARLRCRVAADLINEGRYEAAREALGEHWQGIGGCPNVEGLDERTAAEVLLMVGTLSGWIGASQQVAGSQETAKNLISESAALFERLGEANRAAATRSDLALCYWREGAYDNARVLLEQAAALISGDTELKARTIFRLVVVESSAGRYSDALHLLTDSARLFEESTNHALRGGFHNELALVLRKLGTAEQCQNYFDRAIIEYTAAVYHFEQAGHERYAASIKNNLAFLLIKLGRYEEAHEHLDRARKTLTRLNDAGLLAQVGETQARALIAGQRYREANRVLAGAIQTLEKGGESALLADALTVQGVVWARLEIHESSLNILRRAVEVAEVSGALCSAGRAALTLIEEHGARRLSLTDAHKVYLRADELLKDTQDAEDIARLRACARIVIRRLAGGRLHEEGFTFHGAVHEFEAKFIEQALEESGGSVTKAARLLGISYQSLITLLNTRHGRLYKKRTAPKRRKRSVIKKDAKKLR